MHRIDDDSMQCSVVVCVVRLRLDTGLLLDSYEPTFLKLTFCEELNSGDFV